MVLIQQAVFSRARIAISNFDSGIGHDNPQTRKLEAPTAALKILQSSDVDFGSYTDERSDHCDAPAASISQTSSSQNTSGQLHDPLQSASSYSESLSSSRPVSICDSISSLSSTASAVITMDASSESQSTSTSASVSLLTRLRSSISTGRSSSLSHRKSSISLSDFSIPTEASEKHFIDSVGMVIPGVCDRARCAHPLAHFVTNWRLIEPMEYNTALADHGIAYSDYTRLLSALSSFLTETEEDYRSITSTNSWHGPDSRAKQPSSCHKGGCEQTCPRKSTKSTWERRKQRRIDSFHASRLNELLAEISQRWQKRGLPVMVCVSSFSLFASNRISEALVQIIHVPLESRCDAEGFADRSPASSCPFANPFATVSMQEVYVAVPRPRTKQRRLSASSVPAAAQTPQRRPLQFRDHSKPWPLWPNAIPSNKREMLNESLERYGVDPYFRAWVRANINSRTRCTCYVKYMIERDDDPFVDKRQEYQTLPSRSILLRNALTLRRLKWNTQSPGIINRAHYEHNRRLECRKSIEHGSRLRIVRFGFRFPIYPPHTPEMEELGVSKKAYQNIVSRFEGICTAHRSDKCSTTQSWKYLHGSTAEKRLKTAVELIRELNLNDRRVVWTIEEVPGVYCDGMGRCGTDWEISAWNGEDPLELLIQLEKWGIIEQKLSLEDDWDGYAVI